MIDVKIIRKPKNEGTTSALKTGGTAYGEMAVKEAAHAAKADIAEQAKEAAHAAEADHAKKADRADNADFADVAQTISPTSDLWQEFLRKDKPDAARSLITFLQGIAFKNGKGIDGEGRAKLLSIILESLQSADFDTATESGFGFTKRKDGKYQLSITDMVVWGKAIFNELEKRKLSYVGGNVVFSSCGSKILKVEELDNAYRCYFYQDDGTTATTNLWGNDDQVRCQTFNIKDGVYKGMSNRFYWRRIVGMGEDYIDLSKTDCAENSDTPMVEDTIVQFGNRTNTDRMSLIEVIVNGDEAPAIIWYDGINGYTLEGKRTAIISPKQVIFATQLFKVMNYDGQVVPLQLFLGSWDKGKKYHYYNTVSHNGCIWNCVAPDGVAVTSEPSESNPQWEKIVEKGEKGDQSLELTILTDRGYIIRNGQGEVTLTAIVTQGGIDITDSFTAIDFSWQRNSGNPEYDTEWNNRHKGVGNTITVSAQDIFKRAVFDCILLDK